MSVSYLAIVAFLFILAVFDLMVGVSNDAVNFLNSAIGAKVAKFKTIIIVAAAGVFLGASMSNGMMEIARNGIFHPSMFSFRDVMFIFLAVMISDVLLLDIFNNLGLPTSTTVSLVFELLGGTTAFALFILAGDNTGLGIGDLMNTDKAMAVIGAIFVSVAVAFFFGTVLQYISRLVFTFTYSKNLKWKIGLFGGLATTAIAYFMLFKGLKSVSFVTSGTMEAISENAPLIFGACFLVSSALMQLLHFLKVNVFKVLVLLGTFALAMAFAGNDLVNFIGVPLAGFSSLRDFSASGLDDPSAFMMGSLDGPAKTPFIFLLAAGTVMVVSLATSKKAKNVIRTSVDLSRQSEGDEMFGSSKIARVLVRASNNFGRLVDDLVPQKLKAWTRKRFNNDELRLPEGAAFDEVRATVNLVTASLLIALGTSLKLPLSTTYVTFMVAMGSSLADRAWGRESAVYRITGVVSVIGGWFITAAAAFILCFVIAALLHIGGFFAAFALIGTAVFILVRSNSKYKKKLSEEKSDTTFNEMMLATDKGKILSLLCKHIAASQAEFVDYVNSAYLQTTDGFFDENLGAIQKARSGMRRKRDELKSLRRKEMVGFRRVAPEVAMEKNTWFHLGRNSCEEMLYCLRRIADPCEEHLDNNFVPMDAEQVKEFLPLRDTLLFLLRRTERIFQTDAYDEVDEVRREGNVLKECLDKARESQMRRMQAGKDNINTGYVYLNLLQETREMTSSLRHLLRAAKNLR